MKKLLGFILSALAMVSCTFAINQPSIGSNITKNTSNSFFSANQCYDWWQYYLTWHNYVGDSFVFEDTFRASDTGYHYIFDNSSTITVSDPYNVFNFNGGSNFSWKSNWKPKYVSPYPYEVIFVQKAWSFKIWSLPNWWYNGWVTAQISVRLKRGAFYENSNGTNYTISWFPFGWTSQQSHQRKLTQYSGNTLFSWLECFNYVVHYCGDWVRDTHASMASYTNASTHTYWNNNSVANETCDEWALNWQPGHCNTSCNGYVPQWPICWNWTLEAWEQCDPGSNNFWNGCDSTCHLMAPSCTLTVNPNQWVKPLTTTINGTTQTWATYTNLNFGDWETQSNPTFSLNHTYNTLWTFNLTLTVRNNYNGQINGTRPTATCSASVTTTNPAPYCWDGIINQSSEDCDPGSWNFWNGCNSSCKLMNPTCTLTVNPTQWNVPLTVSINWTTNSWRARITNLNFGDGQTIWNGWDGVSFPQSHTYNTVWTFNLTSTVTNIYTPIRTGVTRPTATCSATVSTTTAPYCWDGILQSNEQCDPGSSNFWNGCDEDCQLTTPSCTLTVNPNHWNTPLTTTINGTRPNWASYTNLNFGDGQQQSNPSLPVNHTYSSVWTFNLTLTVRNNYNGSINGTRPTATCSASVTTTQAPQGILQIEKQLLTTWSFPAWSLVAYKIVLKNIWSWVYNDAFIEEIMPRALLYVSSNIQWIGNNYQFSEWDDTNWQHHVKYYNFDLNPNQSAILYLTWRLRDGYLYDETTNCAVTNWWLNSCVYFTPQPVPYVKKWQKVWNTNFTDQQITVNWWDYIVYKIDFANIWWSPAVWIVKDYLPNCVTYVDSSIHGVDWAVFVSNANNSIILYRDFNLAPWQTWYMLVTGQISTIWSCSNVYSYLNTWSFRFTNSDEVFSTVVAIRPQNQPSVVIFDKTGNKNLMHPGETGLEFYITVTNQWPNAISNIYVDDIRPDNESCIIYDWWTWNTVEETSHLVRHYIWQNSNLGTSGWWRTNHNEWWNEAQVQHNLYWYLYAWQSFNFTIFAHIANNPSCVGSYVNTGKLTYTEWGNTHTLYDDYPFQVVATPNIKVDITKTVDKQYVNHWETVTYTITYTNNGTAPLSNYVIRDYWPAMVEFVSSTPHTDDIVTTNLWSTITWHFSQPLAVGETRTITAVWRVR